MQPPEPWRSFFADIDARLNESDVDFISVVPELRAQLIEVAGKDSALHRKHHVYLDSVTVATPPEDYDQRLVPLFPGSWRHLRLLALEANDLALSRLERNFERDREDVQHLARTGKIQAEILRDRYYRELRPNLLGHETRHDLTLQLWLDAYFS